MDNESITPTDLTIRRRSLFRLAEFLPGFDHYVNAHPDISKYLADQWRLIDGAIRDDDLVRFEDASASWIRACHRVNELLAEEYRQANPSPDAWELRYFKWMKIGYIRFESPRGEFFLVPRRPRRRPKARHWYTADEMMGILSPSVAALLELTDSLPGRPEDFPGPRPGEKHAVVDLTGPEPQSYFLFGKEPRWKRGTS